jgi:MtfA peptidase
MLAEYAPFAASLSPRARKQLEQTIQVMVAEKNWEGCGGLTIEDVQRVTIAAHAARMTLSWGLDPFDEILSILVYPDTYVARGPEMLGSTMVVGDSVRLGEAWYRGPVVLAWRDIEHTARGWNPGHNVVIHEFAHHLDMRNSQQADGVPSIEDKRLAAQWLQMLDVDYGRLVHFCQQGIDTGIDCYAATDHAEFFAVVSEAYFESPHELAHHWPRVYNALHRFYQAEHSLSD